MSRQEADSGNLIVKLRNEGDSYNISKIVGKIRSTVQTLLKHSIRMVVFLTNADLAVQRY